ncbi:hypothetical protein PHABIO_245 [Pseudomonas phage Phabio]|uniref:Uncharacterized protein n=1 Tax=Pseudomonas phage Phabio TaxID=2006668 RepID=A0A1Y0SYZ2_9CAUD|nr:hypothetical protein MZD05_gp245 [Pseudomonas phage Phabio]ARV76876.1 hypothetical protein PHABIO_245 [Pseudomonas phage Phabio]
MWAKLQRYFERKTNGFKKKQYLNLLSELEHPHVTLEHLPLMLVSFWNQFDIKTLDSISAQEWMYITTTLNHNNIAELIYATQDFTNAIAQDDYGVIELAAQERFKVATYLDMDTYLSGLNGEVIDAMYAFKSLKDNIHRHGEIIENVEQLAYRRFLHRYYKDLQTLTILLVNNIKV